MKLVVLTSRFPYPLEKGDKLRIFHQIKYLSRKHEIYLICIADNSPSQDDLKAVLQYVRDVQYYTIPKWQRSMNALFSLMNGKPAQQGYFLDRKIKRKIRSQIVKINPDRIYCQLIRAAEYVKMLPYPKVLDYMDTFSAGMLRQAQSRSFPSSIFYALEARYTRRYEHELYKYFDETLIISQKDRKELPLISKESVHVIPNGIDMEVFKPDAEVNKQYDIAFIGNLGYKPNEQAVLKLYEWVRAMETNNQPKVLIAGARPTSKIQRLNSKRFVVAGWVDDIRKAYNSARVFAAPLFTGSGLQNKILEAMACGLPCITTSLVNDSIGAKPGKEIVICDDPLSFEISVKDLLRDEQYHRDISQSGYAFVTKNYAWDEFNGQLEQIIINAKTKSEQYAY